jgi:hypothetical protein
MIYGTLGNRLITMPQIYIFSFDLQVEQRATEEAL